MIDANPSNYRSLLANLRSGSTLRLAAGSYTQGLPVSNLNGTATAKITITGPETGSQAIFVGSSSQSWNTIELFNSSHIVIKNLRIDGRNVPNVFAVSANGGSSNRTHNITIENCTIVGHGANQQTVAISTKIPTWGWVIRKNLVLGAGTGLYLGNSDGTQPFIAGVIEGNLVDDSEGYGMQIKHQTSRPLVSGMPTTPQKTVIRHNVWVKSDRASRDGDRPNVLIGGLPTTGAGSQDFYEIYGNVFYHNPRESLLQAEGRVSIHDNIFIDAPGTAINLQNHNMTLRRANVYQNTIYQVGRGIRFGSTATEGHAVFGNLIFANTAGISGSATNLSGNITDTPANASYYVNTPSTQWDAMDFYPRAGRVQGTALNLSFFSGETEFNRDFNSRVKSTFNFRGAYSGEGINPGWKLQKARKPIP
ncbi:MAG: hypothetical protein AB1540_16565 [Bdellovibrionota bacterium]